MQMGTGERILCRADREPLAPRFGQGYLKSLWLLLVAATTIFFAACGGGSGTPAGQQTSASVSGNWQFTVAPPGDNSFLGGLQGGFLVQNGGTVTGAAVYSVLLTQLAFPCNSGSAPITGSVSGQTATLAAVAGTQTFTFTGTLSTDGSTMSGTYSSTAGTAPDGSPCGTAQTGLQWSAMSVPPITGPVQGSFHSIGGGTGLADQDFLVTGALTQGPNIGASNATVTGTLSFLNPATNLSDYPCFTIASVNGQISGNSVILQLIDIGGSTVGQIGEPAGSFGSTGINPVTIDSVHGGYVLHGVQPSYLVASKACAGTLESRATAGDVGNICLGLGSAGACSQPITLSPAALNFPAQLLGSAPTTQTITLANNSSSTLVNLSLTFANNNDSQNFPGQSDFNGLPNFVETDTCGQGGVPSGGQPFSLNAAQSCTIAVSFSPQESCPWLPFPAPPSLSGAPPEWCPFPVSAQVTVVSPLSADNNKIFTVPVAGIGASALVPSTSELDFGAEQQPSLSGAGGEASLPQTLSFTNNGGSPVQILGSAPCTNQSINSHNTLPSPRLATSPVAGLQVVSNDVYQILADPNATPVTITYRCDSDPQSSQPNFQISSGTDTCTGTTLAPQASCSLQITYVPQPNTNIGSGGLDYFLELNTVQCYGAVTSDCEIDSGRFPVELKANGPSSLRMSPGAGLDFGNQTVGKNSAPLTITLLNDPSISNPQTVTFVGKFLVSGNYAETDDCPVTLAPNSSCTVSVTFKPGFVGFIPGQITINYAPQQNGSFQQFIYLRGTGQ